MNNELKLSAPWITYYRKIDAIFGKDPDIKVRYNEDDVALKLYVEGQDKADAIRQLLPEEKDFGGVMLRIDVIPANVQQTKASLFRKALQGNPAFSYLQTVEGVFTNPISYCVFEPEVVQVWNDNLADINGNMTLLYETIANEVFEDHEGVCFCTDLVE